MTIINSKLYRNIINDYEEWIVNYDSSSKCTHEKLDDGKIVMAVIDEVFTDGELVINVYESLKECARFLFEMLMDHGYYDEEDFEAWIGFNPWEDRENICNDELFNLLEKHSEV